MEKLSAGSSQSWLSWFWRGILFFGFLLLIGRLFELQIIKGAYFRELSSSNRIRRVPIVAPRGRIIARGGEVLVGNREIKKAVIFDPSEGYLKTDDLSKADSDDLITEYVRTYPLGDNLAHVSGYLGEVSQEQVGKVDPDCPDKGPLKLGDLTGKAGLEKQYQCNLNGIDGEELIEVDSTGKKVRVLGRKEPVAGSDFVTTIDLAMQKKAAEVMKDKLGAVIISDIDGEVLAYYSSPSYDPTDPSKSINDPNLPFFDRVSSGTFHPGSVFKPVVALGALEEGKIDDKYIFDDPGIITVNDFSYSNWYFSQYGKTEGKIDVVRAIARSTDTFFYIIGEMLGAEKVAKWADKFGLNKPTGIDLPGEVGGLIPTPTWKQEVKGERWFLGNTYHVSIGQGDVATTPIGINTYISAIAGKGELCRPYIYSSLGSSCS
ncbi:penicillin-binding transpeptidase domain-containing protein, partial [Patescibacteria group bacterium]